LELAEYLVASPVSPEKSVFKMGMVMGKIEVWNQE
jgi:hypothetical protein